MTDQELQTVTSYVKDHLPDLFEHSPSVVPLDYLRLAERVVRVEEGLLRLGEEMKSQNLLAIARFEAMDKQFEAVQSRFEAMNKQFEMIQKQFEAVQSRFEAVDRRFDDLIHYMDKRFESMEKRFDDMNRRFEEIIHLMDKRFETALQQMDQRFNLWMDQTNRRFEELFRQSNNRFGWMIGLIAATGGGLATLITVFHFLGSGA